MLHFESNDVAMMYHIPVKEIQNHIILTLKKGIFYIDNRKFERISS